MIEICSLGGGQVAPFLEDVARLRIKVFRDFPYLYDGDASYERGYLATYAASAGSVFVLAKDAGRVVGAATGIPLSDEGLAFQEPFRERGIDVGRVFYFGESVLLPEYRGCGIGQRFFDEREAHARALGGFDWTAFAAVDREDDDPRRPPGHVGNEALWRKRGYVRQPGMRMWLAWKELGESSESPKPLTFRLRRLD